MKKLFASAFSLLLLLALTFPVFADFSRVIDNSGLLTDQEIEKLEEEIAAIQAEYDFDVVLLTSDSLEGKTATAFADDFYDQGGYGLGGNNDGILFLVSIDERDWAISTCGYGIEAFTDYGNDYISEQVVPYLSDGDYYQAMRTFTELTDMFLKEAHSAQPYDVTHRVQTAGDIALKIFVVLLLSLGIALMVTLVMKSKLNNAKPQKLAHNYISNFNLNVSRDIFLYSRISRIRRPEQSSGGGSSTHTSSGGVSHGGSSGKF